MRRIMPNLFPKQGNRTLPQLNYLTRRGDRGANSFFPNDISIAPPTMTYSPPSCQLTFRYSYGARCCLGDR